MRSTGHGLCRPLLFLALSIGLTDRATASPSDGPRWGCWYEPDVLVVACVLVRKPTGDYSRSEAEIAARIDRRLPVLLKRVWGTPETLAGAALRIPLWNAPYDMRDAARLADSVMCGLRDDCSVHFDDNLDDQARERAFAIRDGADEATVMAGVATVLAAAAANTVGPLASSPNRGKRRASLMR
jgi:hypothetical protein